jgi:hypothetical protein
VCLPPLIRSFTWGSSKLSFTDAVQIPFVLKIKKNVGMIVQYRPWVGVLIKSGISCEINIFNATMGYAPL